MEFAVSLPTHEGIPLNIKDNSIKSVLEYFTWYAAGELVIQLEFARVTNQIMIHDIDILCLMNEVSPHWVGGRICMPCMDVCINVSIRQSPLVIMNGSFPINM